MKNKLKSFFKSRLFGVLFVLFFLVAAAVIPVSGSPEFAGVTNFDSVWLLDTGGTAQPVLKVNQRGAGMVIEALDNGTRVWGINGAGKVLEGGVNCVKRSTTVTDTAQYTSTVTALSTPTWASCSMSTITGDANNCAIAVGTPGVVSIIVRNSAATPAANTTPAAVNWEACGTP